MTVPPCCGRAAVWFAALLAVLGPAWAVAQEPVPAREPLHERIDRLVEASPGPFAPLAGDEEFLRRASLDLVGLPPTPDEVRGFLADADPAKRAKAIDRLLASPQYARHLSNVFDVMLMERRGNTHVSDDEWRGYLLASFRQNKPLNVLAKEILSADGADPATRPAARFFLDRSVGTTPADRAIEPNLMTRDIGRIFFGRDMQCAHCHDHPLIDDYKQADYQGLLAILQGTVFFTAPAPDGKAYLAERAGAEIAFESVFVKGVRHTTGPKVPGGPELAEPAFHPGDEYTVAPADGVRSVPKFSRRAALAEAATNGSNRWFNENFANRLWAVLMGRGLVHPPDMHHSANPPTNPELLHLLGDELSRTFDVKAFLRELALTRTYQRSIDLPHGGSPGEAAAVKEQLAAREAALKEAAKQSTATYDAAVESWRGAKEASAPVKAEVDAAVAASAEALKAQAAAQAALTQAKSDLAAKQDAAAAVAEAAAKAQAAAAKLPQDTQLAAATQKFVERNTSLMNEVAALTKAAEEKQAAVTQAEAQLAATRQTIDAARAKLAPQLDAIRAADAAMAAARLQMLDDSTAVASVETAVEATGRAVEVATLFDQTSASLAAIPPVEAQVVAARAASDQYVAVMSQSDAGLAAAQHALAETQQQRTAAEQELARRQAIAQSLTTAVAQAESASGQLPEDAALAEAVKTLKSKAEEASAKVAEVTPQVATMQTTEQQAAAAVTAADQARQAAATEQAQRQQTLAQAEQALAAARAAADSLRVTAEAAEAKVVEDRVTAFAAPPLKPLSPEQLCFAMLRVTGHYESNWKAEEAALTQSAPLPADATPEQVAARQAEIEQKVYDKLKGNISAFVSFFAAGAGQPQGDFFATADQALFAANGGSITSWLTPGGGNLTERMINQADPNAVAEDLYVTTLSRRPTPEEAAEVAAQLAARPQEKPACVQELAWALLTSAEFRFDH